MTLLATKREEFLNLSLRQLEKKSQVANSRWSEWFNGKNEPNLSTLERLAKQFGMPVLEFIDAFIERRDRTTSRQKSD